MNKFQDRVLDLVCRILRLKEGFVIEDLTQNGNKAIVRDAFGYRYLVKVELIGRTQESRYATDPHTMDFLEVQRHGN
jgi:hypothetical protein